MFLVFVPTARKLPNQPLYTKFGRLVYSFRKCLPRTCASGEMLPVVERSPSIY